jgi:hypothetical protein
MLRHLKLVFHGRLMIMAKPQHPESSRTGCPGVKLRITVFRPEIYAWETAAKALGSYKKRAVGLLPLPSSCRRRCCP